MTTLRVYVDAPPDVGRDAEWALFDAAGQVVRTGKGRSSDWPVADAVDAIVAAAHGRLVTLTLPSLPVARAAAAARYALEDQLAGAAEDSHLASATQRADGTLRVAIVADAWMRAFMAASAKSGVRWHRVMLESDLAQPPAGGWCWCAAAPDRAGFVRTGDGASIAVGAVRADAPPDELTLALGGSRAPRPRVVRVDIAGASLGLLSRAREATGVEFIAGTPWRWYAAPAAAYTTAIDLQAGAYGTAPVAPRLNAVRPFRPALLVVACALGIHVLSSVGQWLWLHWQSAETRRELAVLARSVAPDANPEMAPATAIARRDAALRHRAGLAATDDLLPLLSRAAPALSTLPAGAIRSFRYVDGHVVLDLQKLDASQPARVQAELLRLGVVAIAAPSATGVRLRVGLD